MSALENSTLVKGFNIESDILNSFKISTYSVKLYGSYHVCQDLAQMHDEPRQKIDKTIEITEFIPCGPERRISDGPSRIQSMGLRLAK